jgi:predicted transcriptional regulator
MDNEFQMPDSDTVGLAADIVSSFVSNNAISATDLPGLISSVHAAIRGLGAPPVAPEPEKQEPAVSVKKSVTAEYLISLEDGRRYKSLKRHLGRLGLTPDGYRQKWGLPSTYPMVAPEYAKKRSELAKAMGLGRTRVEPEATPVPSKRGRPKKA